MIIVELSIDLVYFPLSCKRGKRWILFTFGWNAVVVFVRFFFFHFFRFVHFDIAIVTTLIVADIRVRSQPSVQASLNQWCRHSHHLSFLRFNSEFWRVMSLLNTHICFHLFQIWLFYGTTKQPYLVNIFFIFFLKITLYLMQMKSYNGNHGTAESPVKNNFTIVTAAPFNVDQKQSGYV